LQAWNAKSAAKRVLVLSDCLGSGSLVIQEPLEKEISVEDMQKIVDANEKLVNEMKDGSK